ncbi:MAG: hypothetical protein JNL08_17945 [Planctomycetes bacterium]|nr:hypothetical protein [Planctomycetota bacterium]
MKALLLTSLVSLAGLAACGTTTADVAAAAAPAQSFDINKILAGIKDQPTAEAAKGPLEGAIASLKSLVGGGAAAPTEGATEASGGMKQLGSDVLAKFGIDGATIGTITGLLQNPAVAGAIGPLLNQLKGLIGG